MGNAIVLLLCGWAVVATFLCVVWRVSGKQLKAEYAAKCKADKEACDAHRRDAEMRAGRRADEAEAKCSELMQNCTKLRFTRERGQYGRNRFVVQCCISEEEFRTMFPYPIDCRMQSEVARYISHMVAREMQQVNFRWESEDEYAKQRRPVFPGVL